MIKKLIDKFLKIFLYFGYKISINKISSNIDHILFDKNSWSPYLFRKQNKYFNYYSEGILKSKSSHSDSFSKQLRYYSLLQLASLAIQERDYQNFAECGCWKGHSSYSICKMLMESNFKKKFYIFDSFEGGLSNKVFQDYSVNRYKQNDKDYENQKNYFKSDYTQTKELFNEFSFVDIYKGWIPDKFYKVKDLKFSFVHIDVDLYEPTLNSLNFFYERLVAEGIIICDDYNYSDFPGAKIAVDEFIKNNKIKLFYEVPLGGCIIIK
tara:strand:+ start:6614 stop:7411 length:798 start_codon:yes stop_codon:yes gene_type:complete